MSFVDRAARLPRLGIGISTEFGASETGLDPTHLRDDHPGVVDFLEIGADVDRGFDADAERWIGRGWPTTYHFLDVNLEEPEDLDPDWLAATLALARRAGAAWLCGDAGLWHVGPRDRGHGTLLPPIFCDASARAMAEAVRALRERSGLEVLPENPPAQVLVGDLHPLEYFGRVGEIADCGLLLDVSHLAIVQQALGLRPSALLDVFPVERVVELHVAGGSRFTAGHRTFIDDDHGPEVVDAVWELLEALVPRATALRAVVVECERNPADQVLPLFARVRAAVADAPGWRSPPAVPPRVPVPGDVPAVDHRRLQRTLFRMMLDPTVAPDDPWLAELDRVAVGADPGERRRRQLLGNVALEFVHTVRNAPPFLEGFVGSPELHAALAADTALPLAFAAYAARVLPEGPWTGLLALDTAMARARRSDPDPPAAGAIGVAATVVELPVGTVATADGQPTAGEGRETVVIVGRGPAGPQRTVTVEVVPDGIADLLRSCPLDDGGLARFAARHETDADEVRALVDDLVRDGILAIG